jgi:hypothetical protein
MDRLAGLGTTQAMGQRHQQAVQQRMLVGQQASCTPDFGALQASGRGLNGRAGRLAPGRGGRDVHPGVVVDASGLPCLLEGAEIGVVTIDGEADGRAHRSAVPAVGSYQHRLLAYEPGQRRAGGGGDLANHPAELAQPHDQCDRGQQRQGGQPPAVAAVAAQVNVDSMVDGMGGVRH